jgi:WD40 repeat protein
VLQVLRPEGEGFQPVARLDGQPDIWRACFSSDGRLLAFGNSRGQVGIWDFRKGEMLFTLQAADYAAAGDSQVHLEGFSPDGRYLLTSGSTLRTWDLTTGKTAHQADFSILPAAGWFLNDSRLVGAFSGPRQSQLVNLQTSQVVQQILLARQQAYGKMVVSSDGKYLASSDGYDAVNVYPTGETQPIVHIAPLPGMLVGQAFRLDSQRLALFFALGDTVAGPNPQGLLEVWELKTGQMVLSQNTPLTEKVAYSLDGNQLLLSDNNTGRLYIYDAETGSILYVLDHSEAWPEHGGIWSPFSPAFAAAEIAGQSVFLAGEADGRIWLWKAQTGETLAIFGPIRLSQPPERLSPALSVLAVQPGGRILVSGSWDGILQFWDLRSGVLLGEQPAHNGKISAVSFRPDGKQFITSGEDQTLRLWELK